MLVGGKHFSGGLFARFRRGSLTYRASERPEGERSWQLGHRHLLLRATKNEAVREIFHCWPGRLRQLCCSIRLRGCGNHEAYFGWKFVFGVGCVVLLGFRCDGPTSICSDELVFRGRYFECGLVRDSTEGCGKRSRKNRSRMAGQCVGYVHNPGFDQ